MALVVRELVTVWKFNVDKRPVKGLNSDINKLKNNVLKLGTAFLIFRGIRGIFRAAGEIEQIEIAFEVMLGSAERAKKSLQDIKDFAQTTPFELPELLIGSKRLLAFGFEAENLINTLGVLGDITAGVGKERMPQLILALGQVRAATKLRGQELRQFTETGVPIIAALAESMGVEEKAVQKLVSQGKVSFEQTFAALESLTKKGGRFAGLMEKQSKSLLGILSNISDFLGILVQEIGAGVLPEAKELLKEFLGFLEVNRDIIKSRAVQFFKDMFEIFSAIKNILIPIGRRIFGVLEALGGVERMVVLLTKAVLAFFALQLFFKIGLLAIGLLRLVAILPRITLLWKLMGNASLVAHAKMLAIPLAIGAIIALIALMAEDFIAFTEGKDSVFGRLEDKFNSLGKTARLVFGILATPIRFLMTSIQLAIEAIGVLMGAFTLKEFGQLAAARLKNIFTLGASGGKGGAPTLSSALGLQNIQSNTNPVPGGGGASNSQSVVVAEGAIVVSGAGDPAAVGQEVVKQLGGRMGSMLRGAGRDLAPVVER